MGNTCFNANYIYNNIIIDYQPIKQDIVFPSVDSSLSINITIHDNNLSENIEQFVVQLCYMSEPLKDVCIEASVIIQDDDG